MIGRLRVQVPAGAAGNFSSPELTLCTDSFFGCPFHSHVTAVACKRPLSFCQKCRWQVRSKPLYTFDPMKSEWADYAAVQAYCGNL